MADNNRNRRNTVNSGGTSGQGGAAPRTEDDATRGGIRGERPARRRQNNNGQNRTANERPDNRTGRGNGQRKPANRPNNGTGGRTAQGGIGNTAAAPRMGQVINRGGSVRGVNTTERAKRLDAVILVDMSGSMIGQEEILQRCVEKLYEEVLSDEEASRAVEIGIIAYSSVILIMQEIVEIFRQPHKGRGFEFVCSDATLTGHAVDEALKMLDRRKKEVNGKSLRMYAPQLFILSDGDPYCSERDVQKEDKKLLEEVTKTIRKRVANNELSVFSLMIGDDFQSDAMQQLTGLDTMERTFHIKRDEEEFEDFFKWVSDFLKSKSTGGNPAEYGKVEAMDIKRAGNAPKRSAPTPPNRRT